MDANTKQVLVNAINLIKAGKNHEAVPLLANLLKTEPNLVQGWYLLGLAVDVRERKIKAFQQALKLDPTHAKAFEQLAVLQAQAPSPAEEPAQPSTPASAPEEQQEPEPSPVEEETPPDWAQTFESEPEAESEQPQPHHTEPLEHYEPPEGQQEQEEDQFIPPSFGEISQEGADQEADADDTDRRILDATPTGLQPDFDLPAWMDQESFDPSEYDYGEDSGDIYLNTEEDIPEWAQMNPFESPPTGALGFESQETPEESEPEFEDEPEQPLWAEEPEVEDTEEESEPELPSWAISSRQSPREVEEEEDQETEGTGDDFDRVTAFFDADDKTEDTASDTPPEEPDWLREMVNEEGKDKKARRKAATPTEKKQRRRRIILLVVIVLLVGLGTGGYFFRAQLKPYWDKVAPYANKVIDPVKTQFAPVAILLTEDAPLTYLLTPDFFVTPSPTNTIPPQPTPVPTRTPQPTAPPATATIRATLAPGVTPTVTPTPIPLPVEITTQMEELDNQIRGIRGLSGPSQVERVMVTKPDLQLQMDGLLVNADLVAKLQNDQIVLQSLGFINANYNLVSLALSRQANALGGFYLPESDKVYVVGSYFDGFGALEQYIYVQMYDHAIQDANFDILSLGYYPACLGHKQACLAAQALSEGDAALVGQLWLEEYPPQVGLQDVLNYHPPATLFQPSPPDYFALDTAFASTAGLEFVQYLYDNGGWNAVNRAYSVLPTTTEQILHPEKYQQGEIAGAINFPSFEDLLPQEWQLVTEDSLGEWDTYLLLSHNAYPGAKRPEAEAAMATEGWNADSYKVYYSLEEQQTLLTVYWVWDTPDEAVQFYDSLEASLGPRFGNVKADSPGGDCWLYRNQKSCIQQDGNKVFWLFSDDADLVDTIRERFVLFP